MTKFPGDVMVNVAHDVQVFRRGGVWSWEPPTITKEELLRMLEWQVPRAELKSDLLREALIALRSAS